MKNRIGLIVPYYGKFPDYFPLFLESVKNKPFDVLFFTELEKPPSLLPNVIWRIVSFKELRQLFSVKLNVQLEFQNGYKICDFRPSYGLIFGEFLSGYDFWGSIDIDTVVGNFNNFITDAALNGIDVYSGIKEYISGSFFLIRNNEYCNTLFRKSKDWHNVFLNEKYCGFDECGGQYFHLLEAGKNIFELQTPIQSFTEVILLEREKGLRVEFSSELLEPKGFTPVKINKDGIFYKQKEYLLIHFIYFKARYYFYTNISNVHSTFYITPLGYFKNKPIRLNVLFSKNLILAFIRKVKINLKKLKRLQKRQVHSLDEF